MQKDWQVGKARVLEWRVSQIAAFVLPLVVLTSTVSVEAARLHDPTRPETASVRLNTVNHSVPRLEMILSGVTRQLAVINGQELGVGDRGEGFIVQKIERDAVLIKMTGRSPGRSVVTLRLNGMAKELHP